MKHSIKPALIKAFDESETKSIAEVCRAVGITRAAYYFHFYKDADFREKVLEKRRNARTENSRAIGV